MNKKLTLLLFLVTIISFCYAIPCTLDINDASGYTTERGVNVTYSGSADRNICIIESSGIGDIGSCGTYPTGTGWKLNSASEESKLITLSSTNEEKEIHVFIVNDNNIENAVDGCYNTTTLDNTAPTCTISGFTDEADYNSTTIVGKTFSFTCTDALAGIDTTIAKIGSTEESSGYSLESLSANQAYSLTIDTNDTLGNSRNYTYSITYDTAKPTSAAITSSYKTTYTNDTTPEFTITGVDATSGFTSGKAKLSCSSSFSSYKEIDLNANSTKYSSFDITSGNGCSSSDGNKIIYAKIRDNAGNWSDINAVTNVLLDRVDPSAPTNITLTPANESVTVNWDEADSDDRSGNDYYKIYVYDGTALEKTVSNIDIDDTEKEVTGLENEVEYDFTVCTVDHAGNEDCSTKEAATPATTTASILVKRAGTAVDYAKNNDTLDITCTYSDDATDAIITVKTYEPTGTEDTVKEATTTVKTLSYSFKLTTVSYGRLEISCKADGASSAKKQITIDNTAPIISWLDTNNTFVGLRRVTVKASDTKAFDKVTFDFNKATITATKGSDNNYYFDLNSAKYENGDYALKATVYDKAGNTTEITRTIAAQNTLSPKEKAQKALSQAKAEQTKANEIIAYFDRESLVISAELASKKTEADGLIIAAEPLVTSSPETAFTKATSAFTLLQEFNKKAVVETIDTKNYNFDLNNLAAQLKEAGITESNISLISESITSSGIERKFLVLKAGSEGMRQAKIIITFTNDTNSDIVKIVEIIPKEFVDSAKKIVSDANFRIVKEDPVIEFTVNAPKGTKVSFSYGIGEITTAQATAMIDSNVIQKYSAPPLVLAGTSKAEDVVQDNTLLFIAIIFGGVVFFLLILIIIAVLFFIKFSHPKHGFGEPKTLVGHLTPEQEAEKKKWQANK